MAKCAICEKGAHFGNNVSHSHRKTPKMWKSNVKSVKVKTEGGSKRMYVCTSGFSTVESSINSYKPQKCGIFLSNFIFLYVACVACLWYNGLEVIMIEALF